MHLVVGLLQAFFAGVEGIGVFHNEFTRAHHAETRTGFITEFGLNLVQVQRQLTVAADVVAGQVGNHFFMGRANAEITVVAVFYAQQFATVLEPAAGFFPQLGRLHGGHQHFLSAGFVHFFAHNGFYFAQGTQAQRHPGVQASGQFADHAGTHHQLVADHHGIGGGFFFGG